MIVRLLGSDAEVDFPDVAVDAVRRLEERFPCPEWAVLYEDVENEEEQPVPAEGETPEEVEEVDQLVLCKRYSGVLLGVAYLGLDEIQEMDADGFDWVGQLDEDLSKTTDELARMPHEVGVESGQGGTEDIGSH